MYKLFIAFTVFAFTLQNCETTDKGKETIINVKFEVKNETNKKVNVKYFLKNNSLFKELLINSKDSIIAEEGQIFAPEGSIKYNITYKTDSAIIEFEDGKKITQTILPRNKFDSINNILLENNYTTIGNSKSQFIRKQFTIKESDYLRAK